MKFGAAIPCLNEFRFLPAVIGQLLKVCDRVVILRSRITMGGHQAKLISMPVLDPRIEVIEGNWPTEEATRNAGMEHLIDCDYVFTVDTDEIFSLEALNFLKNSCTLNQRALLGGMHTYWKSCAYRIDPPEQLIAPVLVRKDVRFSRLRMFEGASTVIPRYVMHHLSYVRTDEEVKEKIRTFGHASEVVPGWYENVWKAWDENPFLENLHPTHPSAYKRAIPVTDPKLANILAEYGVA